MKNLVVMKFGGSSVATPELMKNIARRILKLQKKEKKKIVVVVSAPGKTTDHLIKLACDVNRNAGGRELDMLLATGEQQSIALLALAISSMGGKAISLTGPQVGIITDPHFTKARIRQIHPGRIEEELSRGRIVIAAGFQGKTESEEITTLGRGGSDLTAVALASVLEAEVCEIYTDVEGVYSCDPRIIPTAKKVEVITYDEMLELASAGAKVMQSRSMEVAKKFQVPLLIRSSFTFAPGTLVKEADMELEEVVVTGVTHDENQVKVTIPNVPDIPGVAAHIFGALARKNINVDMIIQSAAEGGINDISFTVRKEDLSPARSVMESIRKKFKSQTAVFQPDVAKLSIVGIGMRSHSGVAARMFKALARSGINIEMISTSEIKVSCVVKRENAVRGVKALAKEFGLNN